ncbi:MAG: DUF1592 domain-containing protein [Gemmataceae bacterium]
MTTHLLPRTFSLFSLLVAVSIGRTAEPAPFPKEAQAFLAKHCLACHGEKVQKAAVAFHTYRDEAVLLKDRKLWQRTLAVLASGEMPPPARKQPVPAETAAFTRAVTAVFERADRNAKPDPGRVTVRRLNRTEYNNTIRDLVGVDFQPAEDFPSDDVGHGFDNIGDVLTLSPVLMERYLAAAESVMARAITVDPPKPPQRHLSAMYTEPAAANVPLRNGYRVVTNKAGGSHVETGPIHTSYQVPAEGEYRFRCRVYAEGDGPVPVSILACGKTLPRPASDDAIGKLSGQSVTGLKPFVLVATVDVKARTAKDAQTIEVTVPANLGLTRMAVAMHRPSAGGKPATLFLQSLALEGPLDTRPLSQLKLLACAPGKTRAEQTREVMERFASRAYRRPATRDEVDRLVALVERTTARGERWEAAVQLAMQAVLVSPKFLFRVELDDRPQEPKPHPIDDYQLASRLSYFLWSSMPDQELFDLAAKRQLAAQAPAQVRRMLRDPRAKALVDNFAMQWLQLRRLRTHAADPQLFPRFNEHLRTAMLRETELFFGEIVREDRSALDLIDGKYTYLNGHLARHYGIRDTAGNSHGERKPRPGGQPIGEEFVRVALPDGGPRGGLLTQASVLTVTSNPTRTSPVKRGRWVLEQLLGTPPPPPPPNVPELAEGAKAQLTGTLRQRMEQHRLNPACASCHAKMDALGFAFENFDAVGAWRTTDGTFPIDPSGTLPGGRSFKGPAELKAILREQKDLFARCLTEKLLTYALGRGLEYYDRPAVDAIVATLANNDYRFSVLATEIATSMPFRMRRGKDQTE